MFVAGFFIHDCGAIHCVIPFLKESTEGFMMTSSGITFHSRTVRTKN